MISQKKDVELDVRVLPLLTLESELNKYNYRTLTDEAYDEDTEDIQELKESIRHHGLINPLTVVESTNRRGKFEIIAGHRRFTACKALGIQEIPCIVQEPQNAEKLFMIGLTENIQRNNLKPLEEAQGFQRYMDLFKINTISDLSRKLGKDDKYIRVRLWLLKLPKYMQQEINNGAIAIHTIPIITPIINDKLRNQVLELCIQKKLSVQEITNLVQLVRNYEITESRIHNIDLNKLKEHTDLDLATMLKEHDIEFVAGYFREAQSNKPEKYTSSPQRPAYSSSYDSASNYNDRNSVTTTTTQQIVAANPYERDLMPQQTQVENIALTKKALRSVGELKKNRSMIEIVTGMLKKAAENTRYDNKSGKYFGVSSTKLMYMMFLSYQQINDYKLYLSEKELIVSVRPGPESRSTNDDLAITEKGVEFLKKVNEVFKMLGVTEYEIDIEHCVGVPNAKQV